MMYVQSCFAYEAFFLEGHERFSIWPHFFFFLFFFLFATLITKNIGKEEKKKEKEVARRPNRNYRSL